MQEELAFYSTYPVYIHAEYPYSHLLFPRRKPKDLSTDQDRRSQTGPRSGSQNAHFSFRGVKRKALSLGKQLCDGAHISLFFK